MTDESVWQFPCRVSLKIIGSAREGFIDEIITTFQRVIPGDYSYTQVQSREAKYISITIPVTLQNKLQVDELYGELRKVSGVRLVL